MVSVGFRLVSGSWKMNPISLPRSLRMPSADSLSRSTPSKITEPETILPGGFGTSRVSESAVTLLPQPDSPTSPSVSPWPSTKLTSSTARTTPSGVKKCVERLRTSRRFFLPVFVSRCSRVIRAASSGVSSRLTASYTEVRSCADVKLLLALELRIEGVAQPVSNEREADERQGDHEPRPEREPGVGSDERLAVGDERAPRRAGRLDADADVGEGRLGEDGGGDAEGHGHDDRPDRVRQQVPGHDVPVGHADRPGGLDELRLLQGEELAAHEPGHGHPRGEADGHEHQEDAVERAPEGGLAERHAHEDDEQQVREGVEHVRDAHQDGVGATADPARDRAHRHADEQDDELDDERDRHADLRAVEEPAQDVAAQLV